MQIKLTGRFTLPASDGNHASCAHNLPHQYVWTSQAASRRRRYKKIGQKEKRSSKTMQTKNNTSVTLFSN